MYWWELQTKQTLHAVVFIEPKYIVDFSVYLC